MTMIGRTCRVRGANGKEITKIRKSRKKDLSVGIPFFEEEKI